MLSNETQKKERESSAKRERESRKEGEKSLWNRRIFIISFRNSNKKGKRRKNALFSSPRFARLGWPPPLFYLLFLLLLLLPSPPPRSNSEGLFLSHSHLRFRVKCENKKPCLRWPSAMDRAIVAFCPGRQLCFASLSKHPKRSPLQALCCVISSLLVSHHKSSLLKVMIVKFLLAHNANLITREKSDL